MLHAFVQLDLASWPPRFTGMPFNSFITVPTRSGSGYMVTNNYIANGRGRGVIVRGSNGQVTGNSINYIAFDAINLVPGFDPTREGGFPKAVQVHAALRVQGFTACRCLLLSKGAVPAAEGIPATIGPMAMHVVYSAV